MPKNLPNSIIDETMPFWSGSDASQGKLESSYQENWDAWKAEDSPVTRSALLKSVQPVVDRAVYSYAGTNASPRIKSQAKLMALEAFGTYDANKGNMRTHLLSQLRRLQRYSGQENQMISIPERITLDRRHLRNAEESLRDDLGRDPSDMEVANSTGLSLKRIEHIRKANSGLNSGSIVDAEGETYSPASSIPGDSDVDKAWKQMVYYDLHETDQAIMDYTLGMHGAPKLETSAIAQRMGISPGAVSQRKNKIQSMLDERFTIDPFKS